MKINGIFERSEWRNKKVLKRKCFASKKLLVNVASGE